MKKRINSIPNQECFGGVHGKVFEVILILCFISSLILLTVNFVLTMWFFKYSTSIFVIEIVLLAFNFIASILAIILRAWRSNGSVIKDNSSSYYISIILLLIIIISILGSIATDVLVSYIINFKFIYWAYLPNFRRLEENSTLSISLEESGSNFESNQTEISYDSFGVEANLTYETENISDSGVINSIDNEINTTGIMINESDYNNETDNNIESDNDSQNNHGNDDDDDEGDDEGDHGVLDFPSESKLKAFSKIFNKYENYIKKLFESEEFDDLEDIVKKENFSQLFSYISMSYNALIHFISLICLIFVIKRIKSKTNFGVGVPQEMGVSSFQNMLGNNRKSLMKKGKNNVYNQNTDNFGRKSKKKKGKNDNDEDEGSDKVRIMSKKKQKKRALSRKKKH